MNRPIGRSTDHSYALSPQEQKILDAFRYQIRVFFTWTASCGYGDGDRMFGIQSEQPTGEDSARFIETIRYLVMAMIQEDRASVVPESVEVQLTEWQLLS